MTEMHNPPHPGEVLRGWLADISVTEAAKPPGCDASSVVARGEWLRGRERGHRPSPHEGSRHEGWGGAGTRFRPITTCGRRGGIFAPKFAPSPSDPPPTATRPTRRPNND